MNLKIYQKYLVKHFLNILLKITFVFIVIGIIMGVLEEINFFSEYEVNFYLPIMLVILNIPSLIFEIFPFIFLLTSQFFFIYLIENDEINIFKNNGLSNIKLIYLVTVLSFISGIIIITLFYNFSAVLQFKYLDIKKNFTNDNKYLATITENGLWIKDETNNKINFINAKTFSINSLKEVDIIQLDKNFNFEKNIKSEIANIEENNWLLTNLKIIDKNNSISKKDEMIFYSNFNNADINSLFSKLSSLTIWGLLELKENYKSIKYSTTEIDHHIQRIIAYPFLITIISVLTSILMLNIGFQKQKLFIIVFGIILSVIIYYINFFFGTMGKNEKMPVIVSIWVPILILMISSLIGLVRINEK